MRDKKKLCVMACILLCGFLYAENKVSLSGTWSYTFSSDNRNCTLKGERIVNSSDEDQWFKVVFILAISEYKGGKHVLGYQVGSKSYDTLKTGYQYNDIVIDCSDFKRKQPNSDTYYPVIVLMTYHDGDYHIEDYLIFSNALYFQNTIKDETSRLVNELNYAKLQQNYWSNQISNPYGDTNYAFSMANQWNNTVSDLSRKLIDLGYDLYGGTYTSGQYAKLENIPEIKNNVPSSTYSYTAPPVYVPEYSNTDSDSSKSSSSNAMHKVKESCSSCKGTGKDLYKTWDAPYYGGVMREEWCDICKKVTRPHTHDYCHLCNGSGIWEHWTY